MKSLDAKVLADIRSGVCDTVLKWTVIIGAVGVALTLLRIFEFGFLPIMVLHLTLVGVLWTVYALRAHVPYLVRASIITGAMVVVGAGGHITFGAPTRIEFFIAASTMAAVFFGQRAGLIMVGASVLLIALVFMGFSFGWIPDPVSTAPLSPSNWLTNVVSMVIAAFAPLLAVHRYSVGLNIEHQRVAEANKAKSVFLSTMSHELRTPMTAILGTADMLLAQQAPGPDRDKVARISKAGHLLLDLLTDILDFTKIEANAIVIQPISFQPRELVDDICELFGPLAMEKGVRLHAHVSEDVGGSLVADAGRLRQVLLNLVGNAVKFTDRGQIDVSVSLHRRDTRDVLEIKVADTGIGISEEHQRKLFQPFVQADQGSKRRYEGTGLGLAISRRFVELMGGSLTLSSVPDEGSTFKILIPVDTPAVVQSFSPENRSANAVSRPLRILVAEDNEAIRSLLEAMLQKWGHTVTVAVNGRAAIETLRDASYDAVLMDVQMPEVNGIAAVRAIRDSESEFHQIPIIAITAHAELSDRTAYLKAGFTALVAKPINWGELARVISNLKPDATIERSS